METWLDVAASVFAIGAAIFWFLSAYGHLPPKADLDGPHSNLELVLCSVGRAWTLGWASTVGSQCPNFLAVARPSMAEAQFPRREAP